MEPSCILSWVSFWQNTKIRLSCALVCFWQNLMLSPVLDFVDGPRILIDHLFWGLGPFFMILRIERKKFHLRLFTGAHLGEKPHPKTWRNLTDRRKDIELFSKKNTLWFQQYMTLLLWSTKKELWVIFCLRPGSDEKYSCEFLQVGIRQGFIYEGKNGCNISRKRKELVPFTQLVKARRGKLVLALPNIRFSWNFYQIISGTKYE